MAAASALQRSWLRRIGWLLLIWGAGVLALGIVAALFRILMNLAGLTV
jgi:Protein of unknown function (DUF2474)